MLKELGKRFKKVRKTNATHFGLPVVIADGQEYAVMHKNEFDRKFINILKVNLWSIDSSILSKFTGLDEDKIKKIQAPLVKVLLEGKDAHDIIASVTQQLFTLVVPNLFEVINYYRNLKYGAELISVDKRSVIEIGDYLVYPINEPNDLFFSKYYQN